MLELTPFDKKNCRRTHRAFEKSAVFILYDLQTEYLNEVKGSIWTKTPFQPENHLRADQRFRARYNPLKVRGSDGRTFYDWKFEAEKELFLHLEVPELDHKRPFHSDVL